MKRTKKCFLALVCMMLLCMSFFMTALADSSKVVTLGVNLSDEQVSEMYEYFGTTSDEVVTIMVNNQDERKYMEGIATEEQIGTKTYSCSYVEPTESGGINVKVANLTFVTSSMIASTLLTAGMENCNVVAASPIAVSGTGALTGIMMAYETASGEELSEEQKETAAEELITTGELADEIGQDEASEAMNAIKEEVVEEGLTNTDDIRTVVENVLSEYHVSDELIESITALMETISEYDLDVNALKDTMDNLTEKGFFAKLWDSIKDFFTGTSDNILDNVNDAVLEKSEDTISENDTEITNETTEHYDTSSDTISDSSEKTSNESSSSESLWDRIVNWFTNLFHNLFGNASSETDEKEVEVIVEEPEEEVPTIESDDTSEDSSGITITIEEESEETSDINDHQAPQTRDFSRE